MAKSDVAIVGPRVRISAGTQSKPFSDTTVHVTELENYECSIVCNAKYCGMWYTNFHYPCTYLPYCCWDVQTGNHCPIQYRDTGMRRETEFSWSKHLWATNPIQERRTFVEMYVQEPYGTVVSCHMRQWFPVSYDMGQWFPVSYGQWFPVYWTVVSCTSQQLYHILYSYALS
jgi:hypothetical protein